MNRRKLMVLTGTILIATYANGLAAGACCSLTKSDGHVPDIAIVAANSWGDLMTDDDMYRLTQQAIVVKLGIPVYKGLSVQAQLGAPIRTELGMDGKAGYGGLMFGGGAAYSFPEIAGRLSFALSGSASRSYGFLESSEMQPPMQGHTASHSGKSTLIITEGAGFLVADIKIVNRLNGYCGINMSVDMTELESDSATMQLGEAMGMFSPLVGIRWKPNDRLSVLFEAGFGHNNVLSLGVIFPFKKESDMKLQLGH